LRVNDLPDSWWVPVPDFTRRIWWPTKVWPARSRIISPKAAASMAAWRPVDRASAGA